MDKSDSEIWRDFKTGDEDAFSLIYDTYFRTLCYYGRKFSTDIELVKDCVQDVFTELIHRRRKLSDTDNIQFYLMRSVRRRIARQVNSAKVQFIEFSNDEIIAKNDIPISTDHKHQDEYVDSKIIKDAIKNLPGRQKEAIYLKYFFEFSNREIADIMVLEYQSTSNLLQKAIKTLSGSIHQQKLSLN